MIRGEGAAVSLLASTGPARTVLSSSAGPA